MRDIKRLLNKKGWTGAEVGKALMANLVHDVKMLGKPHEPLFSQEDLERMENSLTSQKEYTAYGVYTSIHREMVDNFNRGQGIHQQFYNGYHQHLLEIMLVIETDTAERAMEEYPVIMTREQYERVVGEVEGTKRGYTVNFRDLIFDTLDFYKGEAPSSIPERIRQALENTKTEPATNKRILSHYNEDTGNGYYSLQDGRRSDEMSDDEWRKAYVTECLESNRLISDGEPEGEYQAFEDFNKEAREYAQKLLFEGAGAIRAACREKGLPAHEELSDDELIQALDDVLDDRKITEASETILKLIGERRRGKAAVWHEYDTVPEGLTKYDILVDGDVMLRYSGRLANDDTNERQQFKEFRQDYPELYQALKEDVEAYVEKARGLKGNQYGKPISTWGELEDLKVPAYVGRSSVIDEEIISIYCDDSTTKGLRDRERIWRKGIAILNSPKEYQVDVDRDGNYIEPDPLKGFLTLDKQAEGRKGEVLHHIRTALIEPSLRHLYAYNTFLDIVGKTYDIDDIKYLGQETEIKEKEINFMNQMIYHFHASVYGSPSEKRRKRGIIRDLFQPIKTEDLKPTEADISNVENKIASLGLSETARIELKDFDKFIDELMGKGGR
jgi:hypothetical protein